MKLSAAIKVLSNEHLLKNHIELARQMIYDFVCQFEEIYGLEHCVFNLHILTHLPDDCERFGVLDNFSSFEFESFLFSVKLMKRAHKNPITEIFNRVQEKINSKFYDSDLTNPQIFRWSYSHFQNGIINMDNSSNNCWFLSKEFEVLRILYFYSSNDMIYCHSYKVKNFKPFFTPPLHPFNSKYIDLYKSDNEYSMVDVEIIGVYFKKIFHYYEDITNIYIAMSH